VHAGLKFITFACGAFKFGIGLESGHLFSHFRSLERHKIPCLNLEQLQKIHHGLGQQVSLVKLILRMIMCVILFGKFGKVF
jgi:hypothetical protein